MPKQHIVVIKNPGGQVARFPMKEWLRRNRGFLPKGLDPDDSTSHELRRALHRAGWDMEVLEDNVVLIKPDENGDTSWADTSIADLEAETPEEGAEEAEEVTFGLERDLQRAIRANIDQLEPGLTIIDGGQERTTDAGRIDILAADSQGQVVVIELKAGSTKDDVIAQVLAYMSAVTRTDKKAVRGIIVAGDFHKRVILAAGAVPNLQLKKYNFRFSFEAVR